MDAEHKAEQERIWTESKPALERLAEVVTAFYRALGSDRQCRHLNELWHRDDAGLGLGFVPPEARDVLEKLASQSGVAVHKTGGPLGKDGYFRLRQDAGLSADKLSAFARRVMKETQTLPEVAAEPASPEIIFQQQVERVTGLEEPADMGRVYKTEVALLVDGFNALTAQLPPAEVLRILQGALARLNLPPQAKPPLLALLGKLCDEVEEG